MNGAFRPGGIGRSGAPRTVAKHTISGMVNVSVPGQYQPLSQVMSRDQLPSLLSRLRQGLDYRRRRRDHPASGRLGPGEGARHGERGG